MKWEKIGEIESYNVFCNKEHNRPIYNVLPKNETPSENMGGYFSLASILNMKGFSPFSKKVKELLAKVK